MAAPDYKTERPTRNEHPMEFYFKPVRPLGQDEDRDRVQDYFKPEGDKPVTWPSQEEAIAAREAHSDLVYPVGRRTRRKIRPVPSGMNELTDLVLRKRVDIRRGHDAQSKAGADRFVAKHPYQGYTSHEGDLNNDGIPEVYVKKGSEFILINGYTTTQSDWARRQAYYSVYDDKHKRKDKPQKQWLADEMDLRYDDPDDPRIMTSGHVPPWNAIAETHGYKMTRAPKNLSTYRVFTSLIIKPLWEQLCDNPDMRPEYKRLYIKVVAHMWNNKIVFPALQRILDEHTFEHVKRLIEDGGWTKEETKYYNQIKNSRVFKDLVWGLVIDNVQLMRSTDPTASSDLRGNIRTSVGAVVGS